MKLFLDLDGVIVDFVSGFEKVMEANGYGKVFRQSFWTDNEALCKEMIKNTPGFWENLGWTKDGKVLWDYVKRYQPCIISTPTFEDPDCIPSKMAWVDRNLPEAGDVHLIRRSHKVLYAKDKVSGKPNLLVDDHISTVNEWRQSGCPAIHHIDSESTIKQRCLHGF